MPTQSTQPLSDLFRQFEGFLPALAAGLLVIVIGLLAGWLAKRATVRFLVWLRLDRLAGRVGWRAAVVKGDVRAALYNVIGSLVMLIVVLIFVDDALNRWGMTAISRIADSLVYYLPNLLLVAIIVGIGMLVSNGIADQVTRSLEEEGVARAALIGKGVKGALVAIVMALALWQLQFAREIVLAGFLIGFGSIGVAFALGAGLGMSKAIEQAMASLLRGDQKKEE